LALQIAINPTLYNAYKLACVLSTNGPHSYAHSRGRLYTVYAQ